ncbi:MAG: class I SAM-dependent methyltransferase [Ilumatobacter sp.]|uniref:class I SAM-dependent methyltransferase n=1 Tax=Ilumatobacter sp. TaxID=1967498 RepID=UPI003C7197E3
MSNDAFIEQNRLNWDDRAGLHAQPTTGYRLDRFRDDRSLLSGVVDFDRRYLGDLTGLSVLHLQCHIGTDTLSLARLGARVTGLDQSGTSLDSARALFESVDTPGRFVQSNVYDAVDALDGEQFDLVYTGVGSLNWLPDIARWGQVVGAFMRPGGHFYIREGHPMAYAIDDGDDVPAGTLRLKYPYFETIEPLTFDDPNTYVDTAGEQLTHSRSHEWNHGIGEVFMALTNAGLRVTTLDEHRFLDWRMIPQQVERDELFHLPDDQIDMVPMMYSIAAMKPA